MLWTCLKGNLNNTYFYVWYGFLPALSPTPFNRLAIAGQDNCFDPYVVNRSVPYCLRIIGMTRKSYLF